jgi:hypothetical protein
LAEILLNGEKALPKMDQTRDYSSGGKLRCSHHEKNEAIIDDFPNDPDQQMLAHVEEDQQAR